MIRGSMFLDDWSSEEVHDADKDRMNTEYLMICFVKGVCAEKRILVLLHFLMV